MNQLTAQSGNAPWWTRTARLYTMDQTWRFHLNHHFRLFQNNTSMVKPIKSAWNVRTSMILKPVGSLLTLFQSVWAVSRSTLGKTPGLSLITTKAKPLSLIRLCQMVSSQMLILKIVQFRLAECMLGAARIIDTTAQESGSGKSMKDSRKFNTLMEPKVSFQDMKRKCVWCAKVNTRRFIVTTWSSLKRTSVTTQLSWLILMTDATSS